MTGAPYSDKQKLVAGLLRLFAGGFGAGAGTWAITASRWLSC